MPRTTPDRLGQTYCIWTTKSGQFGRVALAYYGRVVVNITARSGTAPFNPKRDDSGWRPIIPCPPLGTAEIELADVCDRALALAAWTSYHENRKNKT
jgi:hypothetical protein